MGSNNDNIVSKDIGEKKCIDYNIIVADSTVVWSSNIEGASK